MYAFVLDGFLASEMYCVIQKKMNQKILAFWSTDLYVSFLFNSILGLKERIEKKIHWALESRFNILTTQPQDTPKAS